MLKAGEGPRGAPITVADAVLLGIVRVDLGWLFLCRYRYLRRANLMVSATVYSRLAGCEQET